MKPATVIIALVAFTFFCYRGAEANVTQCYYCVNKCEDPIKIQNCTSPDTIAYKCWSQEYSQGGTTAVVKGCIPDTTETKEVCDSLNQAGDISSCYMCDSDLCNSAVTYSLPFILSISALFLLRLSQ